MAIQQFVGRDALKARALPGLFPYNEESKLKGEKYRRFVINGKAFIADAKDQFCTSFDKGEVYSIDVDSNEEGQLSLANFTTIAQELNMAKTEQLLSSYKLEIKTPIALSEEVMNALV